MLNILSKVSKKERKKKKNHRQKKTPQNKTHNQNRPQQENVSSSVWMEIKSRVEKNKNKHPKISHKWGGGGRRDRTQKTWTEADWYGEIHKTARRIQKYFKKILLILAKP